MSPRTSPPPAATSATPAKETAAATQKRERMRSSPNQRAMSAAKIGVVPRMSAVVEAFVRWIAYTYEIWFRKMPNRAATPSNGRSSRRTRSDPSRTYVSAAKRTAAIP